MIKEDKYIWSRYCRVPDADLAAELDVTVDQLKKLVRKIGWKYIGNHWRQRLAEILSDEEFERDCPPEVLKARRNAVRDSWDPETEYDRRVIKTPKALTKVISRLMG